MTQITSGDSNETQPFWGVDGNIYFASTAGARQPEHVKNNKLTNTMNTIISRGVVKNNTVTQELSAFSYPYTDIWSVQSLLVDYVLIVGRHLVQVTY